MTPVLTYREFVTAVLEMAEQVARNIQGDRDLTSSLVLDTPTGVELAPVDAVFLNADPAWRAVMVTRAIVPILRTLEARQVAWVVPAWAAPYSDYPGTESLIPSEHPARYEVVAVVPIDRERHEVWHSKLVRPLDGGRVKLLPWELRGENDYEGTLIDPLQEALR